MTVPPRHSPRRRHRAVVVVLVLLVAAAWVASRPYPPFQSWRPLVVSPADLIRDYNADPIAADRRYKERRLLVTGVVDSIGTYKVGESYLFLKAGPMGVKATLRELDEGSVLAFVVTGASLTLNCIGAGKLVAVGLRDCRIIDGELLISMTESDRHVRAYDRSAYESSCCPQRLAPR
jgi:hypothetical protein